MITQPSCARLLDSVREALREQITPATTDPELLRSLAMIDDILRVVAIRSEHEVGWMLDEIEDIRVAAEAVAGEGRDDGRVQAALGLLQEATDGASTQLVAQRYSVASDLLATCVEVLLVTGDGDIALVRPVLERRLDHEGAIRGEDLTLVARG